MKNQYEIDYQQGYDNANEEWLDRIDKIRAEIESCRENEEPHLCDYRYHRNEGLDMALDIIDRYKAESEDKE